MPSASPDARPSPPPPPRLHCLITMKEVVMNHLVRATLALSFVAGSLAVPVPAALGRGENAEPGATNTLFVNGTTGSDGNACQTSTAACRTIGAAVAKSRGQGTISVASGTYAEN